MSRPLLQVKDLGVTFGAEGAPVAAVERVSFRLNAGETLAIVGESSSGKSVTALALMRLLPAHRHRARADAGSGAAGRRRAGLGT